MSERPWGVVPKHVRDLRHQNPQWRSIKTARTFEEINAGARGGYWPLIEAVTPGRNIREFTPLMLQNDVTGEVSYDFRRHAGRMPAPKGMTILSSFGFYPYLFPSPYAAYLIPKDIEAGEIVWIDDLIQDIPACGIDVRRADANDESWCRVRLASAPAIWNGEWFDVQFTPETYDSGHWVG